MQIDSAAMLDDVSRRFESELGVELTRTTLLERRYFSQIFELEGNCSEGEKRYILKLGTTTERPCQDEYEMYRSLNALGVRTLTPVLCSESYNYLVTVKEELRDLPSVLKTLASPREVPPYFLRLGRLLKELEEKTRREARFSKEEFDAYLEPRIRQIATLGERQKELLWQKSAALSARLDQKPVLNCLVSDYNLGNLHLDPEHRFVLLDLGDAYYGASCSNLATVYLSLKFGPLQPYREDRRFTDRCFEAFLEGFGSKAPPHPEFLIHLIRGLVLMVLFVEQHPSGSNHPLRRLLSRASNRYQAGRYLRYLSILTEEL